MRLAFAALLAVIAVAGTASAASTKDKGYRQTVRYEERCGRYDWHCNHIDQAIWEHHD